MLYLLFFLSGLSGLIYQVVWVRVFGNVFGNTIYSASLVVAVFMLGLGVGSYVVGTWSDRRYAARPESLLRSYGYFELLIGALGLGISALLPHLAEVSVLVSTYSREASGWYALSTASYLARAGIVLVLLTPITLLMGGTLTLLIRHLVRSDPETAGWRIAVLYGVNTAGAALGCFLTDFTLVPAAGLRSTQMVAVLLNFVAAAGALYLARLRSRRTSGEVRRALVAPPATGLPAIGCDIPHLHQPGARDVGFCGDGDGDRVVPPLHHHARRIPRRVLPAADDHPHRDRRGLTRVRLPVSPHRPAGRVADERAGPLRRVHACRAGDCRRARDRSNRRGRHGVSSGPGPGCRGRARRIGARIHRNCGSTRGRCCSRLVSLRC